jgi:hypothetical protein
MNCPVCGNSLSFLSSVLSGTATEKPPLEQLPDPPNLEITLSGGRKWANWCIQSGFHHSLE